MRSAIQRRKDFVEVFFISMLFLALAMFSSCSSIPREEEASSSAAQYEQAPTSPSQLALLKGGKPLRE